MISEGNRQNRTPGCPVHLATDAAQVGIRASRASAVVIHYDALGWLKSCVDSLRGLRTPSDYFVVDNSPKRELSVRIVEGLVEVRIVGTVDNLGFSGGVNVGIQAADTDVVIVIIPDVTVREDTLSALAEALRAGPRAAIADSRLLHPVGKTIQRADGQLSYPLALANPFGHGEIDERQYDEPREVEYPSGAVFAVKKVGSRRGRLLRRGILPSLFRGDRPLPPGERRRLQGALRVGGGS